MFPFMRALLSLVRYLFLLQAFTLSDTTFLCKVNRFYPSQLHQMVGSGCGQVFAWPYP